MSRAPGRVLSVCDCIFAHLVGTVHADDSEKALIAAAIAQAIGQAGKNRQPVRCTRLLAWTPRARLAALPLGSCLAHSRANPLKMARFFCGFADFVAVFINPKHKACENH